MTRVLRRFSLSVSARISAGFGALVVLGLAVSLLAFWQSGQTDGKIVALAELAAQKDRMDAPGLGLEQLRRMETRYRLNPDMSSQNMMKGAVPLIAANIEAAARHADQAVDRDQLHDIQQQMEQHAGKLERFVRLTRSSEGARARLNAVGEELVGHIAEVLSAARDTAASASAARNLDHQLLLLQIANLRFQSAPRPEYLKIFEDQYQKVEQALEKMGVAAAIRISFVHG